jgi:hypothetical protein
MAGLLHRPQEWSGAKRVVSTAPLPGTLNCCQRNEDGRSAYDSLAQFSIHALLLQCQRSGARPRLVWDDVLLELYQPRHQKPSPPMVLLLMSVGFSKKGMR